jgi:hypothetical protein
MMMTNVPVQCSSPCMYAVLWKRKGVVWERDFSLPGAAATRDAVPQESVVRLVLTLGQASLTVAAGPA